MKLVSSVRDQETKLRTVSVEKFNLFCAEGQTSRNQKSKSNLKTFSLSFCQKKGVWGLVLK